MKIDCTLSIIVPVYNAENYLLDFLSSFSNQTYLDNYIELVFVDNGSTDKSRLLIEEYILNNKSYDIKYLYFDKVADSYAARNYGVKNSKGEIIAFTDSDCILEHNWIENIFKFSEKNRVISGEIEIQVINKKNMWEVFDSFAHLNNKENVLKGKVATANLIVRKSDFLRVGFFTERFSGGDHDWSLRAKALGFDIIYIEDIKVVHPSRKQYSEILKKSKRLAYGTGINHKKNEKALISLVIVFCLKIFCFKTNIRYSKKFRERGFSWKGIIKFNSQFMRIRIEQFKSAIQGYRMINARELEIS